MRGRVRCPNIRDFGERRLVGECGERPPAAGLCVWPSGLATPPAAFWPDICLELTRDGATIRIAACPLTKTFGANCRGRGAFGRNSWRALLLPGRSSQAWLSLPLFRRHDMILHRRRQSAVDCRQSRRRRNGRDARDRAGLVPLGVRCAYHLDRAVRAAGLAGDVDRLTGPMWGRRATWARPVGRRSVTSLCRSSPRACSASPRSASRCAVTRSHEPPIYWRAEHTPLELEAMQTNAPTPVIDALGTMTTGFWLLVIGVSLLTVSAVRGRRERFG